MVLDMPCPQSISGLVVEYIVAIDVTRVRFPADAYLAYLYNQPWLYLHTVIDEGVETSMLLDKRYA